MWLEMSPILPTELQLRQIPFQNLRPEAVGGVAGVVVPAVHVLALALGVHVRAPEVGVNTKSLHKHTNKE